MQKMYNQIKRERTPDWKAAVELAKEEALGQLNEQQNVVAYRNLKDKLFRLDFEIVKGKYPALAGEFPGGIAEGKRRRSRNSS